MMGTTSSPRYSFPLPPTILTSWPLLRLLGRYRRWLMVTWTLFTLLCSATWTLLGFDVLNGRASAGQLLLILGIDLMLLLPTGASILGAVVIESLFETFQHHSDQHYADLLQEIILLQEEILDLRRKIDRGARIPTSIGTRKEAT